MLLPTDFAFSQHNLQDYVDCPRRFRLRYIERITWPAVQSEPVLEIEHKIDMGSRFHRLVQQYYLGIEPDLLVTQYKELELGIWFHNFRSCSHLHHFDIFMPELQLRSTLGGFRLVAKYDLIAVNQEQQILILDWKTSTKLPPIAWLKERIQTRLYPLLFSLQENLFPEGIFTKIMPISMEYWFAEYPSQEMKIDFDLFQLAADREFITDLIGEIASKKMEDFDKTPDDMKCRFCNYRSLCERDVPVGDLKDFEVGFDPDGLAGLSFTDVEEIAF